MDVQDVIEYLHRISVCLSQVRAALNEDDQAFQLDVNPTKRLRALRMRIVNALREIETQ